MTPDLHDQRPTLADIPCEAEGVTLLPEDTGLVRALYGWRPGDDLTDPAPLVPAAG